MSTQEGTIKPYKLELTNIKKIFRGELFKKSQTAVSEVSCGFPEGACTGLMGHNGAGKTTSIRMIFGLLKPDQGQILFNGHPIKRSDRQDIGYMPEVNKLPLNLSCSELLSYQLKLNRPAQVSPKSYRALIESKLQEVELWSHRNKRISQLSKGMGRRLAWAQATIHQPSLLILDEPFSGLDPLGRQLMAKLIHQYRQSGQTIILCTHELWSVNEVCDHLHILHQGRLVYSSLNDPSDDSSREPTLAYELSISGVSLDEMQTLIRQENLPAPDASSEQGYNLRFDFADYQKASIWLKACLQHGILVRDFHRQKTFTEQQLLPYFAGERSA